MTINREGFDSSQFAHISPENRKKRIHIFPIPEYPGAPTTPMDPVEIPERTAQPGEEPEKQPQPEKPGIGVSPIWEPVPELVPAHR